MLHVLIVERDPSAAQSLAAMLKQQKGYLVAGFADDLASALRVARSSNVHIALVNTQLGRLESGYLVADQLNRLEISCVLLTSTAPPFPMPELAAHWLEEPYTIETVGRSLRLASADLIARASLALPPAQAKHDS